MKFLNLISTCWDFEKNGNNQAVRDTWLKWVPSYPELAYRFVFGYGQGADTEKGFPEDGILVRCDDGYADLTAKTRESLRWALSQGCYDGVFRCFPDTYVHIPRLMETKFWDYDYYGDFRGEACHGPNYASGGAGYYLSRSACEYVVSEEPQGVRWKEEELRAEDLVVGNILGRHSDLKYFDNTALFVNHGTHYYPRPDNPYVTAHLSCPGPYDKQLLYDIHQKFTKQQRFIK